MEIRNIYEDFYGDERLYSVLMNEAELVLFSRKSKKEEAEPVVDLDNKKLLLGSGAGIASSLAAGEAGLLGTNLNLENAQVNAKDRQRLVNELQRRAQKQGIKIGTITKGSSDGFYSPSRDLIALPDGEIDPSVLAHELGHAQYHRSGRSKNLLAKAAHKVYGRSMPLFLNPGKSSVAFTGLGTLSGIANEKKKSEGKKLNLWDKTRSIAVPALAVSPVLVAEGAASLKGLKMMKESGASKELLKQSKKKMGHAWGTYASRASIPVMASGIGEYTGRKATKISNSKSKKSENEEK